MSLGHFGAIYVTELTKLFRRLSSTIGLVLCVGFGLFGPTIGLLTNKYVTEPLIEAAKNPQPGVMTVQPELFNVDYAVLSSFGLRGFFFLPILIFIMAGLSFAGEHANRSIREYALRPVPRVTLIMSRWLALCTWVVVAVLVTAVLSLGLGVIFLAPVNEYWPIAESILVAIATDVAFVTIALAAAIFTRSIAATIAILILLFVFQLMLAFGLNLLAWETTQNLAIQMLPPQLSFMDSVFEYADYLVVAQPPLVVGSLCGIKTAWQGYVTLTVIALGSLVSSLWRFQRMDLP